MSPQRTPYLAANWKMHKTRPEAAAFTDALLPRIAATPHDVVICPPFTALAEVAERSLGSAVAVGAQNMHEEGTGAYTGEVSAEMLAEAGASAVILGHSERRQLFGETDEALARKVPAALDAGLTPILCVGETEEQRDAGRTEEVVGAQLRAALAAVNGPGTAGASSGATPGAEPTGANPPGAGRLAEVVIAYEPIWAIGTGKTATAEQAQEACAFIRATVAELAAEGTASATNSSATGGTAPGAADSVRILYGGSVKPGNAAELLALPDVDGALVGGASLDPDEFAAIVQAA